MRVWILYLLLAAAIIISLLACFYDTFPGDVYLNEWTQDHRNSNLTDVMEAITLTGKSEIMLTAAAVLAGGLFAFRRFREGYTTIGALVFMLLLPLLKLIIDRPRPPVDLAGFVDHSGDPGFPSGHTYHSLILFGFCFILTTVFVKKLWLRVSVQLLLCLLVVAISVSRVYLGKHWPSDVLGSYIIGGFFLAVLIWGYHKKELPWCPKTRVVQ